MKVYRLQYTLHTEWYDLKGTYMSRKSAAQRRRRALRDGVPNTFSGYGKNFPRDVQILEDELYSGSSVGGPAVIR